MSNITEVLRAFTITGFNSIETLPSTTFRGWVSKKHYRFTSNLSNKNFNLDVYSHDEMLIPFAYDLNRMATASFESAHGIAPENNLPKSIGWLFIRSYYSAYFAMQAILRLYGISCSQFDSTETSAITEVAKLYALDNGMTASSGYYRCEYDNAAAKISCKQLSNTHQDVWRTFFELLDKLATNVVSAQFLKSDRDKTITYLMNLRTGLSCRNTNGQGNWLSKIRNEINYTHAMGAWFPYAESVDEQDKMFRLIHRWRETPENEQVSCNLANSDHLLFISTCTAVISLCYSLITDIFDTNKNMFLKYSAIKFLNLL